MQKAPANDNLPPQVTQELIDTIRLLVDGLSATDVDYLIRRAIGGAVISPLKFKMLTDNLLVAHSSLRELSNALGKDAINGGAFPMGAAAGAKLADQLAAVNRHVYACVNITGTPP